MICRETIESYLCRNSSGMNSPYVILETAAQNNENKKSFLFRDFDDVLVFNGRGGVNPFFSKVNRYLDKGYWLCGYFSYEFGYHLEPALFHLRRKSPIPLVWLGVCKNPCVFCSSGKSQTGLNSKEVSFVPYSAYNVKNIKPGIEYQEYFSKIRKIKKCLEKGLTYQVNFTFKMKFDFFGSPLSLYLDLRRSQPTAYSAFIDTGQAQILSLSPELFFRREREAVLTRPMKGTSPRGENREKDDMSRGELEKSEKIKAENVMIVDLLRNDLGKVAEKVTVPKLFNVEKYKTLYQLTSTVKAQLKKNTTFEGVFSSLFPCGSVTGAPKIKTMEIINELEKEPRGVYTGAIGYISPGSKACFNVAIRTVYLNKDKGELGVGGGVTYDSGEKPEYKEALLKAKFFVEGYSKVCLMESILWSSCGGYFFLDLHLKRLKTSCDYFCIYLNEKDLRKMLDGLSFPKQGDWKVRVLINSKGYVYIEKKFLNKASFAGKVKIKINRGSIDPENCFLYHKTITQRGLYDCRRKKAKEEGFFEVVFLNNRRELTEGAITNLFILKDKVLYTPPLKCGLLPGVLREHLLNEGKAKERVIYIKDIVNADKVYIGNSVRGLIEAGTICFGNKAIEKP